MKKLLLISGAVSMLTSSFAGQIPAFQQETLEQKAPRAGQGILDNVKENLSDNKINNISVYFIGRNGAFIAIQELLSALLTAQNSKKEVYFYLSPGIKDSDAIGTINWSAITAHFPNFHFGRSQTQEYITDQDLKAVKDKLQPDQKMDVYIEDFALGQIRPTQMITDLSASWSLIDSITFPTDGVGHFGFTAKTQQYLNQLSDSTKDYYSEIWQSLFTGEKTTADYSSKDLKGASQYLPAITNFGQGFNKVNSWVATDQYYLEGTTSPRAWNEIGTGLHQAWTAMTPETQDIFKTAYNLNKFDFSYTTDKKNIVYSGSLMSEATALANEAAVIVDNYNKFHQNYGQVNILYKPHPREKQSNLNKLTETVKKTVNDYSDWFHIVPQEVPIEVFPLTDTFITDLNVETKFAYYMFGTSTSVQTFYEAQATPQIIQFIFPTTQDITTALNWYGKNSTVLDFSKAFSQNMPVKHNQWLIILLATLIPTVVIIASGVGGYYLYRHVKKSKKPVIKSE
ncbi:hypothetical protein SSYRP_v1c02640 [Spiroplasma syrphidicola EA-1]|uniref:Uncharacterized protein n=1 Tax=Spiroplasma syrphidicola EA-1 TaxID=1276229 RepID=R4UI82_9MOLU|nr:polysialyltransferase family glycosyltransferase [Spiroplasma syrphidicola]AGM25860.1 hypothetical protein SSYRP_v1c02640 [Spiroplasma syrphidicola EA-1]